MELASLKNRKKNKTIGVLLVYLLENYSKYFDDFACGLSGERSLTFGLFVSKRALVIKYYVRFAFLFVQTVC